MNNVEGENPIKKYVEKYQGADEKGIILSKKIEEEAKTLEEAKKYLESTKNFLEALAKLLEKNPEFKDKTLEDLLNSQPEPTDYKGFEVGWIQNGLLKFGNEVKKEKNMDILEGLREAEKQLEKTINNIETGAIDIESGESDKK